MKKITEKQYELDKIDKKIMMMLQDDARIHLKTIAKETGVTIDTVHSRIKEMRAKEVLWLTCTVDLKMVGYPYLVDVKFRLKNFDEKSKKEFLTYMMKYPECTDVIEIMGNYDFTCVIAAKNGDHLKEILDEVRYKFKEIIDEILALNILKSHKFDTYTL